MTKNKPANVRDKPEQIKPLFLTKKKTIARKKASKKQTNIMMKMHTNWITHTGCCSNWLSVWAIRVDKPDSLTPAAKANPPPSNSTTLHGNCFCIVGQSIKRFCVDSVVVGTLRSTFDCAAAFALSAFVSANFAVSCGQNGFSAGTKNSKTATNIADVESV